MGNKMWLSMLLDPRNLDSDKSLARTNVRTLADVKSHTYLTYT